MDKRKIADYLHQQLREKITELKSTVEELTEARNNEDKCTVGDKHETGRAMTQMELEKCQAQLIQTENLQTTLSRIDLKKEFITVEFGSLVETDQGNYFFSIAFGKVEIETQTIFCLSTASPIGKILLGKKAGDTVSFHGKDLLIVKIR